MELKEYLEEFGIPKAVFARKAEISLQTLENLIYFKRNDVRLKNALKIEKLTRGLVKCEDLIKKENRI